MYINTLEVSGSKKDVEKFARWLRGRGADVAWVGEKFPQARFNEGYTHQEFGKMNESIYKILAQETGLKTAKKHISVNSETFVCGSGYQGFGSGGYSETTRFYPDESHFEAVGPVESYSTGFTSGHTQRFRKVGKGLAAVTRHAGDSIGGGRTFLNELYVWI